MGVACTTSKLLATGLNWGGGGGGSSLHCGIKELTETSTDITEVTNYAAYALTLPVITCMIQEVTGGLPICGGGGCVTPTGR